MTALVNQILEKALDGKEANEWTQESTFASSQETSAGGTSPSGRKSSALTSDPMPNRGGHAVLCRDPIRCERGDNEPSKEKEPNRGDAIEPEKIVPSGQKPDFRELGGKL